MNKEKAKILIPIIRKIYPNILAKQILGVQPLSPGVGELVSMNKEFKWSRTFSFRPRRSVTGKIIVGWIHKRVRVDWGDRAGPYGPTIVHEFITDKELFAARLKGEI